MRDFVVFIGAGASVPFGIPTMTQMVQQFEERVDNQKSPPIDVSFSVNRQFYQKIKLRLKNYDNYDIESLITILQDMVEFKRIETRVWGNPSVHHLLADGDDASKMRELLRLFSRENQGEAATLLKQVQSFVAESCNISKKPFEIYTEFFNNVSLMGAGITGFRDLANKPSNTKNFNMMVFTTNYDCVLEAYCDDRGFEYNCGESTNHKIAIGKENRELYSPEREAFRIYKLHGSINWYRDENGCMRHADHLVKIGETTSLGRRMDKELLIYPAYEKYTFREPFYHMFHHLKECLVKCKACYVVGYSFRDEDILGLFHDSMELNHNLRLYILDVNANGIANKFSKFSERVETIAASFSIEAAQGLLPF
jgi:hypothetical protein